MRKFKPDEKRENEVLWGDEEGFAGYMKRQEQLLRRRSGLDVR